VHTRFAGGFGKNGCAERGFLMVIKRKFVVLTWFLETRFRALNICHFFRIYFWRDPILGIPFCLFAEGEDLVAGGEAEG
jgi:hypothetical protein